MTRHLLMTIWITLAVVAPLGAQDTQELNHTKVGVLTHGGNALLNDSKIDDPAEYRGGAPPTQRSLVKFSGDVNEGKDGKRGGEFYLGLKKPGTGTTDDAMHDALVATYQDGFRFNLPISAPNLQQGDGSIVVGHWYIQSPNGRYRTYMQDDGNLMVYKVMEPGNWLCPTWSMFTGPVGRCED
jgi:hypothetical protein